MLAMTTLPKLADAFRATSLRRKLTIAAFALLIGAGPVAAACNSVSCASYCIENGYLGGICANGTCHCI
ncbi:hypothetical protein ATN84_12225 [Paramesorhizobium deserti]|uniref:Invertebrate defensins family profile domain-containing protein n=1 Tax=Paramesorhizobium deserti TaxID=1494590 RepID=A0A135HUC5_9HYPH|nr:hypothetical protein [Paramesorhizobium deserti]KXF76779.1 hypothetical protein ATN84_12225 [Paramesorhizobium deserti]